MKIKAVGAYSAKQPLEPMDITRREPGPNDVKIEIAYCGVCHSDLHQVRSEWAGTVYPCVPGHEIVGRVVAVGDQVEKYAPGDLVGVGCIVDSCKHCEECEDGLENYCDHMTGTYNSPTPDEPGHTLGGYSQQIVVHERYVLRIRHFLSVKELPPAPANAQARRQSQRPARRDKADLRFSPATFPVAGA